MAYLISIKFLLFISTLSFGFISDNLLFSSASPIFGSNIEKADYHAHLFALLDILDSQLERDEQENKCEVVASTASPVYFDYNTEIGNETM